MAPNTSSTNTAPPSDGEIDPFVLAAQERWLDLARLGKDAWNAWAEAELKNPKDIWKVIDLSNHSISSGNFEGYLFPLSVKFDNTTFKTDVVFDSARFFQLSSFHGAAFTHKSSFYNTVFMEGVDFGKTTFAKHVSFYDVNFWCGTIVRISVGEKTFIPETGEVSFYEAVFLGQADFSKLKNINTFIAKGAEFKNIVYFSNTVFEEPPDFISTKFNRPPVFFKCSFFYPLMKKSIALPIKGVTKDLIQTKPLAKIYGYCSISDGYARYRRLKQLAAEAHDHEMELRMFALETKAKRFHVLKFDNPSHWPSLALNYLYEWTSGFGQSVMRPTVGLALVFFSSLYAFAALAGEAMILGRPPLSFDGAVWTAAAVNLLPFAGQAVIGREIMTAGICPAPPDAPDFGCLESLYAIGAVEGFLSIVFLFLIGLGLRNRFRIK